MPRQYSAPAACHDSPGGHGRDVLGVGAARAGGKSLTAVEELSCAIGCVVFSIVTIRAGVFPRWTAVLMLIGAAVLSVRAVFVIGLAWLGWSLLAGRYWGHRHS